MIDKSGRIMGRAPAVRQNLGAESSRNENESTVCGWDYVGLANFALRPRIGDGWAIYNFLLERLPVNEQKVEIFILLPDSEFSAGTAAQ